MTTASPLSDLPVDQYKAYYNNEKHSDVTIKFGDFSIKAHKFILQRGSKYFATMFNSGFEETRKGEVELQGDALLAVIAVVRFLYDVDYMGAPTPPPLLWSQLSIQASVYVAAEKYFLPGLQQKVYETMASILNGEETLRQEDLILSLETIWEGTPIEDNMARPLLAKHCHEQLEALHTNEKFLELCEGELGRDLAVLGGVSLIKKRKAEQEAEEQRRKEEQEVRRVEYKKRKNKRSREARKEKKRMN